jgi:hypothetical protein
MAESNALTLYLADHLAGASEAAQLIERELERKPAGELGQFLSEALEQLRHDQQVLKGILEKRGEPDIPIKLPNDGPLSRLRRFQINEATTLEGLQALEFLVLGIHSRTLLWGALEEVARVNPELQALDFAWLKQQAEAHYRRAERLRLGAACATFAATVAREQQSGT